MSDISALRYDYRYEYRKQQAEEQYELTQNFYLRVYVSFEIWNDVDRKDFEWVEEFHCHDKRQYLIGVIHFEKLATAEWTYKHEVSIIVCPDGFVCSADVEYKSVKEKFWKLTGAKAVEKTKESLAQISE